jgi:hypothetical protein
MSQFRQALRLPLHYIEIENALKTFNSPRGFLNGVPFPMLFFLATLMIVAAAGDLRIWIRRTSPRSAPGVRCVVNVLRPVHRGRIVLSICARVAKAFRSHSRPLADARATDPAGFGAILLVAEGPRLPHVGSARPTRLDAAPHSRDVNCCRGTRGTDQTCAHIWHRNQRSGLSDMSSSMTPSVRPQRGQGPMTGCLGAIFQMRVLSRPLQEVARRE